MTTPAQEEFDKLVASNTHRDTVHPEDRSRDSRGDSELSEEEQYRNSKIEAAMRMPAAAGSTELRLPPASFDRGRSTGVKGVIADARSYEAARRAQLMNRASRSARSSTVFGAQQSGFKSESDDTDEDAGDMSDEEGFLQQWREARRRELESEASRAVRTRRTSPSVRAYGRLDEVDWLGYLDAIEKVGKETTVVVFIHDNTSDVSKAFEEELLPLVESYPAVHFVKLHYKEIKFDKVAVPAILAYRDKGNDMVANLTGILEMIPDDEVFSADALEKIFKAHGVL